MDFVEALSRSLAHLAGLAKAIENPILREQVEDELAEIGGHLAGLQGALRRLEGGRWAGEPRRDDVTEMPGPRYLVERLEEEFRRAIRYRTPLSVLLAALDVSQAVDAARGGPAADDVLRRIAAAIRQSTRQTDTAVHDGANIFVILLPQTDYEAACRLSARLAMVVGTLPGDPALDVGIATMTASTRRPQTLLRAAERALSRARLLRTEEMKGTATWMLGGTSRE